MESAKGLIRLKTLNIFNRNCPGYILSLLIGITINSVAVAVIRWRKIIIHFKKETAIIIKRLNLKKLFLITGLGVSMLFLCTSLCLADFVTANLIITPTPCKRGDVLHFKVTVFNNPSANTAPGTAYYGTVVLDNTNMPQLNPWHSEQQTFDYPYPNKTTIMNFTATYTVPQNASNTICFYVVEGQQMNNRISYKHCIQVKPTIKRQALPKVKVTK